MKVRAKFRTVNFASEDMVSNVESFDSYALERRAIKVLDQRRDSHLKLLDIARISALTVPQALRAMLKIR